MHAPGSSWLLAGLITGGVVLAALAVAFGLRGRRGASRSRRAAVLGSATGISWGFMAAVIVGAATLSRSRLLDDDNPDPPCPAAPILTSAASPSRRLPVTVGRP